MRKNGGYDERKRSVGKSRNHLTKIFKIGFFVIQFPLAESMKTQTIAAIDIGSNSLQTRHRRSRAERFVHRILQERERVRLGHETLRNKFLSPKPINLSAEAIANFARSPKAAKPIRSSPWRPLRSRSRKTRRNSSDEIERRTGVRVEVLSSIEEARLIGIAAAQFFGADEYFADQYRHRRRLDRAVADAREPHKLFSMKLGAVGLTEKFIASNPPKKKNSKICAFEIARRARAPLRKKKTRNVAISTGTSGTILNLAALLIFKRRDGKNPKFSSKNSSRSTK
jgi:exopolyphosphatase/guanosine-5'-triphosphate,3'-diphosphate pyrophosphatase